MLASEEQRPTRKTNGHGRAAEKERGVAAIEFALVAWFVIFIIGMICEVGLFLLIQFELQNAVDDAARQIRVNAVSSQAWTTGAFKKEVCRKIVMINNCTAAIRIDVQNAPNFASLKATVPAPESIGPSSPGSPYNEKFNPGSAGLAGSLIVTYDWKFLFPFLRVFGNVDGDSSVRRLYGISIFRNET